MRNDPVGKGKSVTVYGLALLAGFVLFLGTATTAAAQQEASAAVSG